MNTSKKIVAVLLLLSITLANFSCSSDDTSECEMSNQGTVIIDNTKNNGTLFVFFNTDDLRRGRETIYIHPNQTGSVDYPAGTINVKAYVVFNTLNIEDTVEKDTDLESCERITLVY